MALPDERRRWAPLGARGPGLSPLRYVTLSGDTAWDD